MKKTGPNSKYFILFFAIRLPFACILIFFLLDFFSYLYIKPLVSIFPYQIRLIHPDYEFLSFQFVDKGKQSTTIFIDARINRQWTDNHGRKGTQRVLTGNFPVHYLIFQPFILLSCILAWPQIPIKFRIFAFLIAIPAMSISFMLDIPFQIIRIFEQDLISENLSNVIVGAWAEFLNHGGRLFITMMILLFTISPFYLGKKKNRRTERRA